MCVCAFVYTSLLTLLKVTAVASMELTIIIVVHGSFMESVASSLGTVFDCHSEENTTVRSREIILVRKKVTDIVNN